MPVLLLYKRLRRSGLTEKNCEQEMLLENRHPTGKLSEKTAQPGWAPKLHTAAARLAASCNNQHFLMPYRDAPTYYSHSMKANKAQLAMASYRLNCTVQGLLAYCS